jgi:hypothetical protein
MKMLKYIRLLVLTGAITGMSVIPVGVAYAAEGTFTGRDAREQLPATLLGPWKVDMTASHYVGAKPKTATRTFEYTEDGKVLVTFQSVSASGKYSTGHWSADVFGTPAIEYHNSAGSAAFNVVTFRMKDAENFDLTVTRYGSISIRATYKLAADGKSLTYSYDGNVIVYRRWDSLD